MYGAQVFSKWTTGTKGLGVRGSDRMIELIAQHPLVDFVEEDARFYISGGQLSPPWHLDRVDQTSLPLDNYFNYCSGAGLGVNVFILDTGILANHQEFLNTDGTSRVEAGQDFWEVPRGSTNPCTTPCNPNNGGCVFPPPGECYDTECLTSGHGTAVASVLGGNVNGFAKRAHMISVRVAGCQGAASTSSIVSGINYVNAQTHRRPAVVNMSFYREELDPDSGYLDTKVGELIMNGFTVVTSANNQNDNACKTTPARVGGAITVGGTSLRNRPNGPDRRWVDSETVGSNYGACVDIFAPAWDINSASVLSPNAFRASAKSGTSFSAPLASAVAAIILEDTPTYDGLQVWNVMRTLATPDIISNNYLDVKSQEDSLMTGSPNLMLRFGTTRCRAVNP